MFSFLGGITISSYTKQSIIKMGSENESCLKLLTCSNRVSGISLLLTLATLRSSFCAASFLPWMRSQRADSGTHLIYKI